MAYSAFIADSKKIRRMAKVFGCLYGVIVKPWFKVGIPTTLIPNYSVDHMPIVRPIYKSSVILFKAEITINTSVSLGEILLVHLYISGNDFSSHFLW